MIAALFVQPGGVYYGLENVDPWDETRDARTYPGPWPVVAHPPCARWSRLAGFTEHRFGYKRGDDGGCFAAALEAVRTYGGVLEHPSWSSAWDRFDLPEPLWAGGWSLGRMQQTTTGEDMNEVGRQIGEAMDAIARESEEDRYRQQYRAAMKILREIPSGTPDSDLTPEQREAWKAHDEAVRWQADEWHKYLDDSALDED